MPSLAAALFQQLGQPREGHPCLGRGLAEEFGDLVGHPHLVLDHRLGVGEGLAPDVLQFFALPLPAGARS